MSRPDQAVQIYEEYVTEDRTATGDYLRSQQTTEDEEKYREGVKTAETRFHTRIRALTAQL